MNRIGVILLLLFEAVWLNAFLPGHTRGVITLAQAACCEARHSSDAPGKDTPRQRAKSCAVCFFAARLTVATALVVELPPLALVDEVPLSPKGAVVSLARLDLFDSRGPPAV